MYNEEYLLTSLAVRLGGRAAELVVFGQGSTGAGNDLAGATDLATKMVREFGMSAALGPVGYPEGGSVFLGGGGPGMSSRPYAEATQAAIDAEVSKLLRQAEVRAVDVLRSHREDLDALVNLLLERETVDGPDVYRLAGRPDRSAAPPQPAVEVAPHPAASGIDGASGGGTGTAAGGDPGVTTSDGSTQAR
jgi:cell division protease FtsH